jgi:surface antigen
MKRAFWLVGLGVCVFLVSMVARFPATVTYQALADRLGGDVSLSSIKGTIFSGEARALLGNQYVFDSVAWRWRPMAALAGRLEFGTELKTPAGAIVCRVGMGFGGDLIVSQVEGRLSLVTVLSSLNAKTGGFSGWIQPEIREMRFRDSDLKAMEGSLHLRNFAWQNGDSVALGDFVAAFDNQEMPWAFSLRDDGGPVRLSGDLTVEAQGAYQLNVAVAPRQQSPELDRFFAIIGPGDSEGQRFLTYNGNLDEL